jgi:hypothetical protein
MNVITYPNSQNRLARIPAMKLHSEEMQEYPYAQTAKRIAKSVSSLRSLGQSPNPQEK